MPNTCPICKKFCNERTNFQSLSLEISCATCGDYTIYDVLAAEIAANETPDYILSGLIRNRILESPINFPYENLDAFKKSFNIPKTVPEKADYLLSFFNQRTSFGGERIRLNSEDYSIAFCTNEIEFEYLLRYLQDMEYIKKEGQTNYQLTHTGFRKAEELLHKRPKGDQCFVAMSFAAELNDVFINGIDKAISAANYRTMRVDKEQHNNKIDDKIISEIRKSSLLIADVTMHRQGVYFEAGFAMGLEIPVIWMCSETDKNNIHFDTRQYNHIIWKDAEDLKEQLFNRIQALYPRNETK